PDIGREAEAEEFDGIGVNAAFLEVIAGGLAGGFVGEGVLPALRDLLVNLEERVLEMAVLLAVGIVVEFDGDAGALGEAAHGVHERDALELLDEGEDVAALVAAEAVKNLALGIDVEAGRLLAVEGAERGEIGAGALEGHVGADDIDDVTGGANLLNRCGRNHAGHEAGPTAASKQQLTNPVSGSRQISRPLLHFLVLGRRGMNEEEGGIILDGLAAEGRLEDIGLDGAKLGEKGAAVDVLLKGDGGGDFLLGVFAGVEQRGTRDQDAEEADHAGARAEVEFTATEKIAAGELAAGAFFDEGENDLHHHGSGDIAGDVAEQVAHRGGVREGIAERAVKESAGRDDGDPLEHDNALDRHAVLAALARAEQGHDDDQQVEPADGHFIEVHSCSIFGHFSSVTRNTKQLSGQNWRGKRVSGIVAEPVTDGGALAVAGVEFEDFEVVRPGGRGTMKLLGIE